MDRPAGVSGGVLVLAGPLLILEAMQEPAHMKPRIDVAASAAGRECPRRLAEKLPGTGANAASGRLTILLRRSRINYLLIDWQAVQERTGSTPHEPRHARAIRH